MRMRSMVGGLTALLMSSLAFSEEEMDPATSALTTWLNAPAVNAACEVSRSKSSANPSFGGTRILMSGGGPALEPFAGKFHIRVDGDTRVVASDSANPGFVLFSTAEHDVIRQTYEDVPMGLREVRQDLDALLDRARLGKWLLRATWMKSGERTYEATLSRRTFPSPPSSNPIAAAPRNLAVHGKIELSETGALSRMELRVERTDPSAALQRRIMKGGVPGLEGLPLGGGLDEEEEDDDGAPKADVVVTYVLAPTAKPHARVTLAERQLRATLDGKPTTGP